MGEKKNRSKAKYRVISWCLSGCILMLTGCRIASEPTELKIYGSNAAASQTAASTRTDPDSAASSAIRSEATLPGPSARIICEIKGHIIRPGVYDLEAGSRVHDLVGRAGGILTSGSLDLINQARKLEDGEVIIVPGIGVTKEDYEGMMPGTPPAVKNGAESPSGSKDQDPLIDINTADCALLETIPGIGPVMAQNIIDYRTANGPFSIPEDLKKVDRIGEKTFEKLRVYITVTP